MHELTIKEIYASVQGESSFAGLPCTFIRTAGCPLRCRWCDTVYSFHGGESLTVKEILARVEQLGVPLVELTGGEPLAQSGAIPLMRALLENGYRVLIETSGSESIADVPEDVCVIMDLKCPGSGMVDRNLWENISALRRHHEVKFVISDREDYDWALTVMRDHELAQRCSILFSPAFGQLPAKDLVAWMLESRVNVRLNLQQHKYIWSPRTKGV